MQFQSVNNWHFELITLLVPYMQFDKKISSVKFKHFSPGGISATPGERGVCNCGKEIRILAIKNTESLNFRRESFGSWGICNYLSHV